MIKLKSITEEAAACREAWRGIDWNGAAAWHCHHERLAELLTEPAENRIAYILANKPEGEQALRLHLFRPVNGAALASARKAYDAALASARKAYGAAVTPAREAYYAALASARKAYDAAVTPAREAYYAALASARKAYYAAVAPAHAEECPGCPWSGETIFP